MTYFIAFISILLGAVGQFILKLAATGLKVQGESGIMPFLLTFLRSPMIYLGLFFFGSSFLLWVWILTKLDLSRAYPLVGLSYVVVVALSGLVLKEPITWQRWMGVSLIIAGVLVVAKK